MSPPNRPKSTATPSASIDRSRIDRLCSRRTFIAAGSTTALVSLAGCSAFADFLADMALQEVNVFNGADQSVSGSIEVVDPDDETVLEETFDLEEEPEEDEETGDSNEALAQYDNVWTGTGDYEVTVALDEPPAEETNDDSSENTENETNESEGAEPTPVEDADGNETDGNESDSDDPSQSGPSKTDTVSVDDTDEQRLVIGIAQEGPADLISYHVIEDFSDLEDEFE